MTAGAQGNEIGDPKVAGIIGYVLGSIRFIGKELLL